MSEPKVNPVHFKPTWFFVRMPDEADDILEAFGKGALSLSDGEMIILRLCVTTAAEYLSLSDNERDKKMGRVAAGISERLKVVLDIEFGDNDANW